MAKGTMHKIRAAALYFMAVFGAAFILGIVRVSLLVPRLGKRTAELLEAPLMLAVLVLAARWIGLRSSSARCEPLTFGFLALGFVLTADLIVGVRRQAFFPGISEYRPTVGVAFRGMSPKDTLFDRDPVTGAVYYGHALPVRGNALALEQNIIIIIGVRLIERPGFRDQNPNVRYKVKPASMRRPPPVKTDALRESFRLCLGPVRSASIRTLQ